MYQCCPEMPEIERTLRTGYPYAWYEEEDEPEGEPEDEEGYDDI